MRTMNKVTPKIDFAVGGQAVIEGVMMRSPNFYVVSVRDEKGAIHSQEKPFKSVMDRLKFLKLPLLRGVVHLVESMGIGFKALDFSNDIFLGEHEKEKKERNRLVNLLMGIFSVVYVVGTLAFTIFLLKLIPLWVAGKAAQLWPLVEQNYLLFNAIDGATKITIFISYILLISLLKDIRRVFQYHGAEHMSIWAYEQGLELTVENARKQTRFHPRCGTSFLFIVILMSIFVYTLVPPAEGFWGMLGQRLIVIPIIAGISYEFLKLSAKWQNSWLMRVFASPGLMIQRLTTRQPDDEQLEVALHSLKASLKAEQLPVL